MTLDDVQHAAHARRAALVQSLLFVAGFTITFVALGASATLVGRVLVTYRVWVSRIGGLLVLVFGLYLLGVLKVGVLSRERRIHFSDKPLGYLGTVVVGIAFGAGWTPCVGPILGAILMYAGSSVDVSRGVSLLLAYSLGLGVPFVITAVAIEWFLGAFAAIRRHLIWIERISGAVLVIVGVLMLTDSLAAITGALQAWTPSALRSRL